MNDVIISQMTEVVKNYMTKYQSDFYTYDKDYIEDAPKFPMLWIVGPCHTHLLRLGEFHDCYNNDEEYRYAHAQSPVFDYYINELAEGDRVFLVRPEGIREIDQSCAKHVVKDIITPTVLEWAQNHEMPKRFKVKVNLHVSQDKLKELLRDCEAHEDNSLASALHVFRHRHQVGPNHHIDIYYNDYRNEFTFVEKYDDEREGLVGGIVFHGWPETGYKENFSVQLVPKYGWNMHT